jgi:hypothetical protein
MLIWSEVSETKKAAEIAALEKFEPTGSGYSVFYALQCSIKPAPE